MKNRAPAALLSAAWLIPVAVSAQETPRLGMPGNDQQTLQREEERERKRAIAAPGVRSSTTPGAGYPTLPAEAPCFRIHRFTLDVPAALPAATRTQGASALPLDRFAFARDWLGHYAGQCVGKQGIDVLVKGLSQVILARGYITTRVLLPEQDLSAGTLALALIPGTIRHVRFADEALRGTWKTAFPMRDGDLLNVRDLEQGLEQMKRMSSQDVSMQIVPADAPGQSDVVLNVRRTKPWTLVASVDDAGARATGKRQGNLSLGIDNPFGLNGVFNVGVSHDLEFGERLRSHGWNGFYAIPWGYWTATLSAYTNMYYQQIAGVNQTFIASGNSKTFELKLHRVLWRGQNNVLGARFRLSRRFGQSFIEGTEIPQQRRNTAFIEVGLTDRHYLGNAQFDGSLAYRQGIAGFGAHDDNLATVGGPTSRYRMAILDANLSAPLSIAGQPLRYVTTLHGQHTADMLHYIDNLTIGSRYTVRGFDGETMLAGARGFYWRNELQMPIKATAHAAYIGVDYGRVWGPKPVALVGTQLAGMAVGVKGGVASRFGAYSYDLFAGRPVYKPPHFPTARMTFGFRLAAQF